MKFTEQLKTLGFASYGEYLQSSHWSNFKKRYKAAGQRMKCLVCGEGPIQLHHHTYVRLGAELFTDVSPLCRPHHEAVHEWLKASGLIFVEQTHKAVVALGGEWVLPLPVKGQSLPRKGRKRKKKRGRVASGFELHLLKAKAANNVTEEVGHLVAAFKTLDLTKNQAKAVERFAISKDAQGLLNLLRSVVNLKSSNPKKKNLKKAKAKGKVTAPLRPPPQPWKSAVFKRYTGNE